MFPRCIGATAATGSSSTSSSSLSSIPHHRNALPPLHLHPRMHCLPLLPLLHRHLRMYHHPPVVAAARLGSDLETERAVMGILAAFEVAFSELAAVVVVVQHP